MSQSVPDFNSTTYNTADTAQDKCLPLLTTLLPSFAYRTALPTEGKSLSELCRLKKPCLLSDSHRGVVGEASRSWIPTLSYSLTSCNRTDTKPFIRYHFECQILRQPPSTRFLLSPYICNRDSYQMAGGTCLERKWGECTRNMQRQNRERQTRQKKKKQNACTMLMLAPKCPTYACTNGSLYRCTPTNLSINNPVY